MKRLVFSSLAIVAVMATALMVSAAPAVADNLTISLSNGTATATCSEASSCNTSTLPGTVTFTTDLGSTVFTTVSVGGTGSGSPALGGLDMDLSYSLTVPIGSSTSGTIFTIGVSENDLSASNATFSALINGNQSTGMGTAFAAFASTSNTEFGGTALCSAGPVGTPSVDLMCSSAAFTASNFALTEDVTIIDSTQSGGLNASGDARLTTTPEPGTLVMFGSGLLGLAGILRRKLHA